MTFEKLRESIMDAIKATELSPDERANLAGDVMHKLRVPGTIWSPEDYVDAITDELEGGDDDDWDDARVKELSNQAFEAHANGGNDLSDDDWDVIREYASEVVGADD